MENMTLDHTRFALTAFSIIIYRRRSRWKRHLPGTSLAWLKDKLLCNAQIIFRFQPSAAPAK
jgi:hypothetical protein